MSHGVINFINDEAGFYTGGRAVFNWSMEHVIVPRQNSKLDIWQKCSTQAWGHTVVQQLNVW